jgi:hypothetical protein
LKGSPSTLTVSRRAAGVAQVTISRVRCTDEAREGFSAFLAKRPASWIPRE